MKTKDLTLCALFSALTAILAQISIPLPSGVPMTLQVLAIILCGVVLGSYKGFIAILVYVLLGAVGLPVFAGFSGGIQHIFGPTGGFIVSFPFMALIVGFISEKTNNYIFIFIGSLVALSFNYVTGVTVFMVITKSSLMASIAACVIPFVLSDLIKCFVATLVGARLKQNSYIKNVLYKNTTSA